MRSRLRILAVFVVVTPWLPAIAAADCPSGELVVNHDHSFEDGYCWPVEGLLPPYYGCLAESYGLGAGEISCGVFWLTGVGLPDPPADVYVWEGGITGDPGQVVIVVPRVEFNNVPVWPSVGQNDVEIGVSVTGEFTIGYWPINYYEPHWGHYYCGVDLNGPGGHPWTCIAPGLEWPSGWQDPSLIWGPTQSMGIGVHFDPRDPASIDESPDGAENATSPTWGGIKALFR